MHAKVCMCVCSVSVFFFGGRELLLRGRGGAAHVAIFSLRVWHAAHQVWERSFSFFHVCNMLTFGGAYHAMSAVAGLSRL